MRAAASTEPLPSELAGAHRGWLTGYRRYPVFSRAWALGRMRTWGAGLAVLSALTLMVDLGQPSTPSHPLVGAVSLLLVMLFMLVLPTQLGPWLGWQVRARSAAWPPRWEYAALVAAMLATVATTWLSLEYVRPVIKDAVVHWIAGPNPPKARVMLGLTIKSEAIDGSAGSEASAAPTAASAAPGVSMGEGAGWQSKLVSAVLFATLTLWLAGGTGLIGWRHERAALAELQRQRELQQAEQARRAAEQAKREADVRLSVLQAQVEPHFLFNTLAGVRSAVTGDPGRAVEIVDRLVDYLRASIPRLRSSDQAVDATLGAQLEIVRAYLALMRSRIPRLSFSIDAPQELLGLGVPPLMLISLVENAVKHGIEPKVGPGQIQVTARRSGQGRDARLEVAVRDDGVGFAGGATNSAHAGTGIGLVNIRERLAQMHGQCAALTLKAPPEGGMVAAISLPVEEPT